MPEQERRRKLVRQATHGAMESSNSTDMSFNKQQEQIKTGWSLLSTLHCVLLGEKVSSLGCTNHKKILVELLAVKWQDRCLQVISAKVKPYPECVTVILESIARVQQKPH